MLTFMSAADSGQILFYLITFFVFSHDFYHTKWKSCGGLVTKSWGGIL